MLCLFLPYLNSEATIYKRSAENKTFYQNWLNDSSSFNIRQCIYTRKNHKLITNCKQKYIFKQCNIVKLLDTRDLKRYLKQKQSLKKPLKHQELFSFPVMKYNLKCKSVCTKFHKNLFRDATVKMSQYTRIHNMQYILSKTCDTEQLLVGQICIWSIEVES